MFISIKNFRVFKKKTPFQISPLTILVGPNNSGKSSFTKLLLILKDGFKNLTISKDNQHNIDSLDQAFTWKSTSNHIELEFSATSKRMYFADQRGEILYNKEGFLDKFTLLDGIFKCKPYGDSANRSATELEHYDCHFDLEEWLKWILNPIESQLLQVGNKYKINLFDMSLETLEEVEIKLAQKSGTTEDDQELKIVIQLAKLFKVLKKGEDSASLFDLTINNDLITRDHIGKILEIQKKAFSNFIIGSYELYRFYKNLTSVYEQTIKTLQKHFSEEYKNEHVRVQGSALGLSLFETCKYPVDVNPDGDLYSFIELFFYSTFDNLEALKKTTYIPAHRGNQQRTFPKGSYNFDIGQKFSIKPENLSLYDQISMVNKKMLLKDMMDALGINGEVVTEPFENSVYSFYIKKEGVQVNLADFGFGYSQLTPVILEICNLLRNEPKVIIIEEPEANLHPALQSKLADLFGVAMSYFPYVKFVIETHSEYFIRKLQYLVAMQDIDKDKCVIHYFNSDENVSLNEPKVKTIYITENGDLTDTFGPGFYDESIKIQFDLLQIKKSQNN